LVIAYCRIEGLEPVPNSALAGLPLGAGIWVATTPNGALPTADQPGRPENVSGVLLIFNNDIEVVGTADVASLGIVIVSVGKSPDKEVDIYLSGNNIRNNTERAFNVQQVGGRAYIERNVIATSVNMCPGGGIKPLVDAIKIQGSGSYMVAHNSIDTAWTNGAGIRLRDLPALGAAIERAIVVNNDVTMSAPEGTVFGTGSAGIEIRGYGQGNVILNNRIRGRARAALSVAGQGAGIPGNNTFVLNDHDGLKSSLADVFVGPGVTNTLVVGVQNTVEDHGVGTIIARTARRLERHLVFEKQASE
jgi:hypothetical protein